MIRLDASQLAKFCQITGVFSDDTSISVSEKAFSALKSKRLVLSLVSHNNVVVEDFTLKCGMTSGHLKIIVGGQGSEVCLDEFCTGRFDVRLWRGSSVSIGERTTSNGIRIILDNSSFSCGRDCMFSDNVIVQTADQHAIVSLESGDIINTTRKSVVLGDHVWLGRNVTVGPNASIGKGSLVGISSVVVGDIPEMSIAVGNIAKVVRSNVTWSRSAVTLDKISSGYVKDFHN